MDGPTCRIQAAQRRLGVEKTDSWIFEVYQHVHSLRPRQDRCLKSLAKIVDPVEAAWKLFYALREVGQLRELRDWRESLVKHLEETQLWLPGVTIDEYLDGVSYFTKYNDLGRGTEWIEIAKSRFAPELIEIAEQDANHRITSGTSTPPVVTPRKRTYLETVLNDDDSPEYIIEPLPTRRSKRICIDLDEYDDHGKRLPSLTSFTPSSDVPTTLWPCVTDEAYSSIISNAETGIKLPPLHREEFTVDPGPHDWREGDIQHWFDVLQAACDRIKVITLPLTYAELKQQAIDGRKGKKKAQYKYTPEEEVQWERAVEDWDAATAELPVIEGDAILNTMDGEVVLYKLDRVLMDGWEDAELGAKFVGESGDSLGSEEAGVAAPGAHSNPRSPPDGEPRDPTSSLVRPAPYSRQRRQPTPRL
jgi:hypothetical protein